MKVLLALMFFPRGGSAQVMRYLAKNLSDNGWEPTIVAGSAKGEADAEKFFEGLDATMARGGGDTLIGLLLVLAFTVLGVVVVFRTAATQKKEQAAAEAAAGHTAI